MKDLISIIIPVYNQTKELELALASIKKQTYQNLEIIIEEDKNHEGAPIMRNRGLAKAQGEFVIFWDADIVAIPRMLEVMKECLDNNPSISFVYCDFKFQISNFKFPKKIKSQIFNVQKLRENNYIHSTSLIRKKDAIRWDESLKRFQDWDLWLTMTEHGKQGMWVDEYLFKIIARGQISSWLPRLAYHAPFKYLPGIRKKVQDYEQAKEIIIKKHNI